MDAKEKLGKLLVEEGVITESQLLDALSAQEDAGLPLGETLISQHSITENRLLNFLSRRLQVDYINISENNFQVLDPSLADTLPADLCRRLKILPVFLHELDDEKEMTLAMSNPLNEDAIQQVEDVAGCKVTPVLTTSSDIEGGIEKLFAAPPLFASNEGDKEDTDSPGTGKVRFVNRLLVQAIQLEATDIHIEPHAREAHIRFRLDGVLHLMQTIPLENITPIVYRLKIMGSEHYSVMRLDKKNIPHEGSFARVLGGHNVDFRVCTFPTIYGEKVAIRIFDKGSRRTIHRIDDLLMAPNTAKQLRRCIKQSGGIIIATGPTGSGKTTTLHTAVNEINRVGLNIVTVEDPVEYHAEDYVNQSNVLPLAGFTYSKALRSILRQDPDVILVGEIRDLETAQVAIQAALTGHLVLTTMHTEDAAGAVVRLVDLGIEEFLVSCTVVSAINQRLLRVNCPHCAAPYSPSEDELLDMGIDAEVARDIVTNQDSYTIRKGAGCEQCRNTGYHGRMGTYEFLSVTPLIKKLIRTKETSDVISVTAREQQKINMLFEDGLRLVLSGNTTFEELERVPRGDYPLKPISEIFQAAGVIP